MKDVVRIEIDAPLEKVVSLYADPANSERWMEDTDYQPLGDSSGAPGSQYRLISKSPHIEFTVTVVARDLPRELRLDLDSESVSVAIKVNFTALSSNRTELISEELFQFKGFLQKGIGLLARPAVRKAHRRQMEAFKRFAESA